MGTSRGEGAREREREREGEGKREMDNKKETKNGGRETRGDRRRDEEAAAGYDMTLPAGLDNKPDRSMVHQQRLPPHLRIHACSQPKAPEAPNTRDGAAWGICPIAHTQENKKEGDKEKRMEEGAIRKKRRR